MKTFETLGTISSALLMACAAIPDSRVASLNDSSGGTSLAVATDAATAASKTLTTTAASNEALNPPAVDSFIVATPPNPDRFRVIPPAFIDPPAADVSGQAIQVAAAQPPAPVYPTAPVAPAAPNKAVVYQRQTYSSCGPNACGPGRFRIFGRR